MSRRFLSGSTTVLLTSMLTMVVAFAIWSMISPVAPQLQRTLGLTEFQKSLLVATPVLLGSAFRIPVGMLTDRFGGRTVYTVLMLFVLIPLYGITTAHTFAAFLAWEVLLGISGTSFAVGIGHVSAWYPPEKQGLILGITAIGNIGTAVAGFTIPHLYASLGFSGMARLLMVPVALSALALWVFTRDAVKSSPGTSRLEQISARRVRTSAQPTTPRERFWSRREVWLLSFYYFITFGGFVAFGNYLPTLLQSQLHLQAVDAGARAAGFVVLATAMRPVGGYLADRLKPSVLLIVAFVATCVASIAWSIGIHHMAVTTTCALAIAVMFGIGNGSVFKMVPASFPDNTGKATGIVGAIGGIGGFFPPLIMGAFLQRTGSYMGGFLLLAAVTVVATILALLTLRGPKNTVPLSTVPRHRHAHV
ncbi:MAG: MFS transporter [Alicyclobacillus sp.]|nr:MFS transporter [Alicyclobacillus sp.]